MFPYIFVVKHNTQKSETHPQGSASQKRNGFFWLVIVVAPILILGVAELILRWIDYDGNLDLVVKRTVLGKEYYTLNREVARRYFSQKGIAIPEAYDDLFEVHKRPNTKRVFMLGESTMAGFPFDYNATAPRLLQDRLAQLLPEYNLEVVNVGLSAINSYTALDFINELTNYQPDAFVLYVGHNEFYGAMGIGSTEYLGQWRWLVNGYLQMRNFRLFLLVRDGVVAALNAFRPSVTPRESTLMEAMVRDKTISYQSKDYKIARGIFEENLKAIIAVARDHHVPLIVSTLASNIRNQEPLQASFSEGVGDDAKLRWNGAFEQGKAREASSNFKEAIGRFRDAIGIDSTNADAHFQLATCFDTLGEYPEAKREYVKARDYDGLRFRASSEFNDLIRSICRQEHIPVADAERSFEQQSPHGLVGANLMLEHLHPNFDGYFLLAKTFFQAFVDNNVLVPPGAWRWDRNLPDEQFKELSGATDFDIEVARYRIAHLTAGWPFHRATGSNSEHHPQNKIQELAVRYAGKKIAWSQARYDLADWYKLQGEFRKAFREYFAVSKITPYYYYPSMLMGDMYRMLKEDSTAESTYRQALSLEESPFIHVRLGMMYFEQGKTDKAIREFEETLAADAIGSEKMDVRSRSTAYYFLGLGYGKGGNIEKARAQFRLALQIDPNNEDAKKMLAKIPQ